MPEVPAETFALACMAVVAGSRDYIPPLGRGSLYLRPLLLGTGPILGLGPAPSYSFVVFGAAVGAYFKVGAVLPACRARGCAASHPSCIDCFHLHAQPWPGCTEPGP